MNSIIKLMNWRKFCREMHTHKYLSINVFKLFLITFVFNCHNLLLYLEKNLKLFYRMQNVSNCYWELFFTLVIDLKTTFASKTSFLKHRGEVLFIKLLAEAIQPSTLVQPSTLLRVPYQPLLWITCLIAAMK